jgi:endoglucanase
VPAGLTWRGVNLAGAEFTSTALPGTYAKQYIYPSVASIAYFQAKGMNFVRLPFLWERLQPALNSNLDPTELQRLKDFVAGATAKGITVMLDPHSYGRYRRQVVGSAAVPNAAFGDFWARVAGVFKGNNKVVFGLMNEPYGMATEAWVSAANEALRRIRAAGAANVVMVPGNAWTGAHSWNASWYGTPNGVAMKQIVDPANNMLIEAHQYLDDDSSGTSSTCTSATIGAERLAAFTTWLRANGKRGFLGEFAAANNATCKQALAGMLAYMASNKDVWAGWSYWAAGPWWGAADMFSVEPTGSADKPQMAILQPYL